MSIAAGCASLAATLGSGDGIKYTRFAACYPSTQQGTQVYRLLLGGEWRKGAISTMCAYVQGSMEYL